MAMQQKKLIARIEALEAGNQVNDKQGYGSLQDFGQKVDNQSNQNARNQLGGDEDPDIAALRNRFA